MEVKSKNGAVVRAGRGMTSDLVQELPKGTLVFVWRRCSIKHNNKDVVRAELVRPCRGFCSLKMLQPSGRTPPPEYFEPLPEELAAAEAAEEVDLDDVQE